MVPIGIVTRNRVAYLDVTLRSLSATNLPTATPVYIFDDASDADASRIYYTTSRKVDLEMKWPAHGMWRKLGLSVINENDRPPVGLRGRVCVVTLGAKPTGVVNASCKALTWMFEHYPKANGVILLQDDVLFKQDWYERMMAAVQDASLFGKKKLGILAGLHLNKKIGGDLSGVREGGITGQCIYVSRAAFKNANGFFTGKHNSRQKFDDQLKRAVSRSGLWAGLILPFVCQHFGVVSLVRPRRTWHRGKKGRIGFYVNPPYALADTVRKFKG
jgi:hypothetical protein